MLVRETVRSGRRANFYITENSFIDNYASEAGPMGIAVYHVLERHMNFETKSTWVGTAKVAELLNVSQRTVQRTLNLLEELRLIRIVRTVTMTTYVILPVPPRGKMATLPLFDGADDQEVPPLRDDGVAYATATSRQATSASRPATVASQTSDTYDAPYKEEQELLNKTSEQEDSPAAKCAERLVRILGLPDTLMATVTAAVNAEVKQTGLSMEGAAARIATAANMHKRRGGATENFFVDFLAQISAQELIEELSLPVTTSLISAVTAAVKAEAKYMGLSMEGAAGRIAHEASDDRRRGTPINKYYFEDAKWRSGNGKAKQSSEERLQQELDILRKHLE